MHNARQTRVLKQAMMTLQGMAGHRFTSVSLFTNVFLGEIIFFPLNFFPPNFCLLGFDAVSTVRTCCGTHTKSPRKWRPKVNKKTQA